MKQKLKKIGRIRNALIGTTLAFSLLTGCDGCDKPIVGPKTDNPEIWAMYMHRPEYREAYYEQYGQPGEHPRPNLIQANPDQEPQYYFAEPRPSALRQVQPIDIDGTRYEQYEVLGLSTTPASFYVPTTLDARFKDLIRDIDSTRAIESASQMEEVLSRIGSHYLGDENWKIDGKHCISENDLSFAEEHIEDIARYEK